MATSVFYISKLKVFFSDESKNYEPHVSFLVEQVRLLNAFYVHYYSIFFCLLSFLTVIFKGPTILLVTAQTKI